MQGLFLMFLDIYVSKTSASCPSPGTILEKYFNVLVEYLGAGCEKYFSVKDDRLSIQYTCWVIKVLLFKYIYQYMMQLIVVNLFVCCIKLPNLFWMKINFKYEFSNLFRNLRITRTFARIRTDTSKWILLKIKPYDFFIVQDFETKASKC